MSDRRDVRTPALICAVLSAAQVVAALVGLAVPAYALGADPILWFAVLLAILHVQQLAAVLAVARSGYAGAGALATTGLALTALGGVAFLAGELLYVVDVAVADPVFTAASVASGIGMVLVGIAVLQTRRWAGPARFLPLAIGVYVFVVLTPGDRRDVRRPARHRRMGCAVAAAGCGAVHHDAGAGRCPLTPDRPRPWTPCSALIKASMSFLEIDKRPLSLDRRELDRRPAHH